MHSQQSRNAWFSRTIAGATVAMLVALALSSCAPLAKIGGSNTDYFPPNLPRSTPVAQTYQGCPPQGQGGDPALNALENRTDDNPPNGYRVTDLSTVLTVPTTSQVDNKPRSQWSAADTQRVAQYEGAPVRTTGWVVAAHKGGPTPAGCNSSASRDWYLWISTGAGDDPHTALVVVVTPQVAASRPGWTDYTMRRLVGQVVRVSGWLTYDQEPNPVIANDRASAWEILPVMHMEAYYQHQWINLDLIPFGQRVSGTPGAGLSPATPPSTPGK